MADTKPIGEAPRDLSEIATQQSTLILPTFTSNTAYTLGTSLRTRLQTLYPNIPALISISLSNSDQIIFQATSGPGITPDNEIWVRRKRNTVKRFGISSWAVGRKYDGDEALFQKKLMLGDRAGDYAIHGGGVPVYVRGVEGLVAVVVVSGLKQDMDHMIVVEGLLGLLQEKEEGVEGGSS